MRNTPPLLLGVIAVFISCGSANGGTVFNEDFNAYATGNLVGQGTPAWVQLLAATANPLQVNAAKAVPLTTSGQDAQRAYDSQVLLTAGNSLRTEFDVTLSAAGTGDFFSMLTSSAAGSAYYNRVYAQSSSVGLFKLGLSAGTPNTSTTPFYGGDISLDQPHHVVTTWNFISGAANDTFSMTVDGAPYVSEFPWNSATTEPANVANFGLRQGTTGSAATVSGIDNILVTSVPEPSTSLLAGSAGALLMQRRRKRLAR